jgi:hypothetical protein
LRASKITSVWKRFRCLEIVLSLKKLKAESVITEEHCRYAVLYEDELQESQADVENLIDVKKNLTRPAHIGKQELHT